MKDTFLDKEFPKANLLEIKLIGFSKYHWLPFYTRLANCGHLYIYPLSITWRLPWHPLACWNKGWDACFRKENKLNLNPITHNRKFRDLWDKNLGEFYE